MKGKRIVFFLFQSFEAHCNKFEVKLNLICKYALRTESYLQISCKVKEFIFTIFLQRWKDFVDIHDKLQSTTTAPTDSEIENREN